MSLKLLQQLAANAITLDPNDPEVKKRFAEARKRQAMFDKEIEARVKAKVPSNELLNRVVNL